MQPWAATARAYSLHPVQAVQAPVLLVEDHLTEHAGVIKKYWTISRLFSGRLGRIEVPQLPVISVVMPWKSLPLRLEAEQGQASEWLWMSISPGPPSARTSTTSRASSPSSGAMRAMRPSRMRRQRHRAGNAFRPPPCRPAESDHTRLLPPFFLQRPAGEPSTPPAISPERGGMTTAAVPLYIGRPDRVSPSSAPCPFWSRWPPSFRGEGAPHQHVADARRLSPSRCTPTGPAPAPGQRP